MYPKITVNETSITVYLNGEIDHHSARELRESIDSLIQSKKPSQLNLDFSGVTFMDSSGIGLVMGRYRMMKLFGGNVKAVKVPEHLKKIMKLSGLEALNVIVGKEDSDGN